MAIYYSLKVPYVPREFQTEWHPDEDTGPFNLLTRGKFNTIGEAIAWAREHLNGTPYSIGEYQAPADKCTNVSAVHVDTCLPCYLTDHHTRDGELLVGIEPRGQSVDEAASDLADEAESVGDDRLPSDLTRDELVLTFARALTGVDLRWIGADGRRTYMQPNEIDDDDSERSQVWFVLSWEEV